MHLSAAGGVVRGRCTRLRCAGAASGLFCLVGSPAPPLEQTRQTGQVEQRGTGQVHSASRYTQVHTGRQTAATTGAEDRVLTPQRRVVQVETTRDSNSGDSGATKSRDRRHRVPPATKNNKKKYLSDSGTPNSTAQSPRGNLRGDFLRQRACRVGRSETSGFESQENENSRY
ncbi:hypothetical protein SKAU_G00117980 [Synaphobranchus kaupii]|uniref:Uncharacterized protein n=1 Tax=Synaphobranchus kaupii TaxID=118154 RepID=A0A9Q1FNT4_SYNKA|nr:hypothetical protein SKAU_G00117980 [Synaphobranchus kaupii]